MKVLKGWFCVVGLLIGSNLSFSQYKKQYFIQPDIEDLAKYQFSFSSVDKRFTLDQKVNLYIEQVILKDTNAIGFYTGLNSFKEFQELRKDKKALYKKIDAEHHAKNIHILDLNKDGQEDFIFNYFSSEAETTNIQIFINKGNHYISQSVPGDFIVNFSNWETVYFETFAWACCADPYRHYYISTFKNDSLVIEKHVQIPVNLVVPDKILTNGINLHVECGVVAPEPKNVFETPEGLKPMSYFGKVITIEKDHNSACFFDFRENNVSKYFIEIPVIDKRNPDVETTVFGWLLW